jgi:hypothetical protein
MMEKPDVDHVEGLSPAISSVWQELAMLVILVGFWLLWMVSRTPNLSRAQAARRIYLYEHGFIIVDRPDDPQVYRWDEIDTVFQKIVNQRVNGINTGTSYLYTITRRDGRTVKLIGFWAGIAELGPCINQRVSAALLPGALAAIDRGQGGSPPGTAACRCLAGYPPGAAPGSWPQAGRGAVPESDAPPGPRPEPGPGDRPAAPGAHRDPVRAGQGAETRIHRRDRRS